MNSVTCKRCQTILGENYSFFAVAAANGKCNECLQQEKRIEVLLEMARILRSDELIVLEVNCSDIFAVGNTVTKRKLVFDADGHAFIDLDKQEVTEEDWFEWGQELYVGPKSYNEYDHYRKFKRLMSELGLPESDTDYFEDLQDWQLEHELFYLSEQKIGLVFTAGTEETGPMDIWVSAHLGNRPSLDPTVPWAEQPYFGFWHVHELNDLFRKFRFNAYEDENGDPAQKNLAIANELESWANWLGNLDKNTYRQEMRGRDYNEEGPRI
jgi:hypothetical protein